MNGDDLNEMVAGRFIKYARMDGDDCLIIGLDDGNELVAYSDGNKIVVEVNS